MRKIIKKIMPKMILRIMRKLRDNRKLKKYYFQDMKRFKKSSFNYNVSKDNLLAKMIINYHSLEKGLTNLNFREGFGQRAIGGIKEAIIDYNRLGFDTNNDEYKATLGVIKAYLNKHQQSSIDLSDLKNFFEKYSANFDKETLLGGSEIISKLEIINQLKSNFKNFVFSRSSIRDYSSEDIDIKTLKECFTLAAKTPSVCNRQPWKVHVIQNLQLASELLRIQNGFKGHGNNLQTLLLITSDNRYLYGYLERNQGYIDAGMYAMNLLYAIHSKGLAACPLNSNLSMIDENKVRELLTIDESENLIMFIAIGHYLDLNKTTVSHSKNTEEYVILHN